MDYSSFTKLAAAEVNNIFDYIEEGYPDIEIDILSDVLHIYTDQGEYVINQHSPTQQIWLSSPVSNAGYFNYVLDNQSWLDKNGESLRQRLSRDLGVLINEI